MTDTAKKFDFGNSFDMTERGMVAARDYTLADVEDAQRRGIEEGRARGLAEAQADAEQAATKALDSIGTHLGDLFNDLMTTRDEIERDMVAALHTIVATIVPHYAKTHALDEIDGLVRECLSSLHEEPTVVISVHDSMLYPIQALIDSLITASGFGGKAVLFADPGLAPTDCRVEWADGGAERNLNRLQTDIENALARTHGAEPGIHGQG